MLQISSNLSGAVAYKSGAMEADTITKNGRSSKSQMSRNKHFSLTIVASHLLSICLLLIGCTSTKLFYYGTDKSTPMNEKAIIGLVDNLGGMLEVVSIDGDESVKIGKPGVTPNKSFVVKSGTHSIVLYFYRQGRDMAMTPPGQINPAGRVSTDFSLTPVSVRESAGALILKDNFVAGQVYLVMPRQATGLLASKDIWIEVYEGDKLDTYGLSKMDVNHLTKIYKNILAEYKK